MSANCQRTLAILCILSSLLSVIIQAVPVPTQLPISLTISPDSNVGEDLTDLETTSSIPTTPSVTQEVGVVPSVTTFNGMEPVDESDEGDQNGKLESIKPVSPGFLLYEVQRDLASLTLDDIEYILDLGEDIFSYSLGDKLGYLKTNHDPHIKVIEASKDILIKKLETRREKFIDSIEGVDASEKPDLQDNPAVATTLPPQTHMQDKSFLRSKVAYEIATGIQDLSLEAIDRMLSFGPEFGSLPYALSQELGYGADESDEHFQYLAGKDDSVLRGILEKTRKSKLEESLRASQKPVQTELDLTPSPQQPDVLMKDASSPVESDGVREEIEKTPTSEQPDGTPVNSPDLHNDKYKDENNELTTLNQDKGSLTPNEEEIPNEIDDEELITPIERDFPFTIDIDIKDKALLVQMLNDTSFLEYLYDVDGELYEALREGEVNEEIAMELLQEYREWLDATEGGDTFEQEPDEMEELPLEEEEGEEEGVGSDEAKADVEGVPVDGGDYEEGEEYLGEFLSNVYRGFPNSCNSCQGLQGLIKLL